MNLHACVFHLFFWSHPGCRHCCPCRPCCRPQQIGFSMFFWLFLLLTSLTTFLEKPSRIGLLGPLQIMLRSSHCKNTDKPNLGVFRSQRVLDVCEQIKLQEKWHINEGPQEQTHKQKSPNKQTSLVPVPKLTVSKHSVQKLRRTLNKNSTRIQQEPSTTLQNNPKHSSRKKSPKQSKRLLTKPFQKTPQEVSTTIQKNPSTTLQNNPKHSS